MAASNQDADLAIPAQGWSNDDDLAIPLNNSLAPLNNKKNILSYLPNTSDPLTNWNITSGIASLLFRDPTMSNVVANFPEIATGTTPTSSQKFEQSVGRNLPSFAVPEIKGLGYLTQALSRIGGQAGYSALINPDNSKKAAIETGLAQTAGEIPELLSKPISWLAEKVNPEKFAGSIAEQIRNLGQSGHEEAQSYYNPVNKKYDDSLMTTTPEKYLNFTPEEKQYFKPETNRRYRDFLAEPTFRNLHELQSSMGKQPELWMQRDDVKQKLFSYLKQDPESLALYQKGSDTMRDKYYPYVSNDTLSNIVDTQKKINKFDPKQLSKALDKNPVVDASNKAINPLDHPLVGLNDQLKNELYKGQAYQYGIPMTLGALTGHMLEPSYGALGGGTMGALFGKFGEPQILKLAQNPWITNILKGANAGVKTGARQAVGYNLYNQQ